MGEPSSHSSERAPWATAGYALGGAVDGLIFNAITIYLMFYLTEVANVRPAMAGLAMAAALAADALTSPLLGLASDRWGGRWGRRLPFMAGALVPLLAAFIAAFSVPALVRDLTSAASLAALLALLRILLAAFQLTHLAWGVELDTGYRQHFATMAWRWTCNVGGGLVAILLGFGLHLAGAGLRDPQHYLRMAIDVGVLAGIAGLVTCTGAARNLAAFPQARSSRQRSVLRREFSNLWQTRSFRTMLAGSGLFYIGYSLNAALNVHAKTYFWHLSSPGIRDVTLALFVGLACAGPLVRVALVRLEKRIVAGAGFTFVALATALPVFARIAGTWPFSGRDQELVLSGFAAITGIAMGCTGIAWNSMLADAADEHELHSGQRREALFYASVAFANKLAMAIGMLIAGNWIAMSRAPGAVSRTAEAGTDRLGLLIGIAYGPGAATFWLLALLPLLGYRIDRRRHSELIAELAARRAGSPGEAN